MQAIVRNASSFPVEKSTPIRDPRSQKIRRVTEILPPLITRTTTVNEGDEFFALTPKGKISLGLVTLLRLKKDVAADSPGAAIGPLAYAVAKPGSFPRLTIGSPVKYRDAQIFSQKTTLKPFNGGNPWVDIVNVTEIPLTFQDGLGEPSSYFTIQPGEKHRYKGRYHFGINYGTYIKNLDGLFETVQILSPITHLIYGAI